MSNEGARLKALISKRASGQAHYAEMMYRVYVLERILARISASEYRDNFVVKGGLLLTNLFNNEQRVTRDLDATIRSISGNKEELSSILSNIFEQPNEDGISFALKSSSYIMENNDYGGWKFKIQAKIDNLVINVSIDLSVGDAITPGPELVTYKTILDGEEFLIRAYPVATVISEKFLAMVAFRAQNTRMKDFYDLSVLFSLYEVDREETLAAIGATFVQRGYLPLSVGQADILFQELAADTYMAEKWNRYQAKELFGAQLSWAEVIENVSSGIRRVLELAG